MPKGKSSSEKTRMERFMRNSVICSVRNAINNPMSEQSSRDKLSRNIKSRGGYFRENNPRWQGGIKNRTDGYIAIKLREHPNSDMHGYIMQHILVMEKYLGRHLKPEEEIHHIDFDKSNNNLNNLKLMTHESHTSYHSKLRWLILNDIGYKIKIGV